MSRTTTHPGIIFNRVILTRHPEVSSLEVCMELDLNLDDYTKFLKGELDCSLDLADKLASFVGSSSYFWYNLQMNHNSTKVKPTDSVDVELSKLLEVDNDSLSQ